MASTLARPLSSISVSRTAGYAYPCPSPQGFGYPSAWRFTQALGRLSA